MNPDTSTQPDAPPLRVFTLGRFVIERDGDPLSLGGKSQRKPLDLLKALIALGGQSISVEKLSEALWPDSDGDRAQGALSTTLHRLRKLIGPDALNLGNSRLSLDPALCWVDSWAFSDLVGQASKAIDEGEVGTARNCMEQALALYSGPFLDGEFDLAEVLTAREKLHGQFLRHVAKIGEASSAAGENDKAIALYQKGLEIDELAEEFYQNLMRSLHSEGRTAEAKSVYKRCKEILQSAGGIEPSPETVAIGEALDSTESHPPATRQSAADANPSAPQSSREKPSIAVMPFDNLSDDASQGFFADGLVEEILTSLSKVSSMTVIARNSTFAYRGKAVDVRQVAQELGVRYVVEGSVRKSGERLRVTAQLIDSADGSHIWAERYDRVVEDIFDIQDEITKEIVTALRVKLSDSELALLFSRGTDNFKAWGLCVEALEFFQRFNPTDHVRALELVENAIGLDPNYGLAWAMLGEFYWYDSRTAFTADSDHAFARSMELEKKARALDETNIWLFRLSIFNRISSRKFDEAVSIAEHAISIYPGSAEIWWIHGVALYANGQAEQAVSKIKDAMRLNPHYPPHYVSWLSRALDAAGEPAESMRVIEAGLARNPTQFGLIFNRAVILSRDGPEPEAKQAVADLRRISPNFRASHVQAFLMHRDKKIGDMLAKCLRKAGLPE